MFYKRRKRAPATYSGALGKQEVQLVEINGYGFVSNLLWHPLSNARSYMREAKTFGKDHDCDIVAVRRGTRIQAGFVASGSQKLKGMYSLAAALAAQHGDSWLGAFALGDGRYAVVAVYEKLVCPGYDVLCDAKRATELLRNALSLYSFSNDAIFAPAEFEFAEQEGDIYALLAPKKLRKSDKLKQLTFGMTRNQLILIGCGVIAVSGIIIGFYQWTQTQADNKIMAQREAHAEEVKRLAAANARTRHRLELEALAHPWATQPLSSDFASACSLLVAKLPLSVAGWVFGVADCSGKFVKITYNRKPGATVLSFRGSVKKSLGDDASFEFVGGDIANVSKPLTVIGGGDDELVDADAVLPRFVSYFQALNLTFTLSEVPVKITPPKAPPGQPPIAAPDATWRQFHFTVDRNSDPIWDFANAGQVHGNADDGESARLTSLSGLRVDDIKTTLESQGQSLLWHIEGNIYAKK